MIPTPDASKLVDSETYEHYYNSCFHLPKSFIRFSSGIQDVIGCLYNLDEIDDAWYQSACINQNESIKSILTEDQLEIVLTSLELAGNEKVEIVILFFIILLGIWRCSDI